MLAAESPTTFKAVKSISMGQMCIRDSPKLPDLLQVLFVFRCGKLVLSGLIFPPDRKAPVHHLNGLPVQHQAVVRTGVQKLSVVGHQDKALF